MWTSCLDGGRVVALVPIWLRWIAYCCRKWDDALNLKQLSGIGTKTGKESVETESVYWLKDCVRCE